MSEYWDENWLDHDTIQAPPRIDWNYEREMQIEDVDLWEVIYEQSGGIGVYAAYMPYAEFYLLRLGWELEIKGQGIETYYGKGAMKKVMSRMKEMKIPFAINNVWVDEDKLYLFSE